MEERRRQGMDEVECEPLRRGWCLGSEGFREEMLERMEGQLGEQHAGELKRESAKVRAERIIAEEMKRQGWTEAQLAQRRKGDPLQMGTRKSVVTRLQEARRQPRESIEDGQCYGLTPHIAHA
jgi:hypothetical protein